MGFALQIFIYVMFQVACFCLLHYLFICLESFRSVWNEQKNTKKPFRPCVKWFSGDWRKGIKIIIYSIFIHCECRLEQEEKNSSSMRLSNQTFLLYSNSITSFAGIKYIDIKMKQARIYTTEGIEFLNTSEDQRKKERISLLFLCPSAFYFACHRTNVCLSLKLLGLSL